MAMSEIKRERCERQEQAHAEQPLASPQSQEDALQVAFLPFRAGRDGRGGLQCFERRCCAERNALEFWILTKKILDQRPRIPAGFARDINRQQIRDHLPCDVHSFAPVPGMISRHAFLVCISFNLARWTFTFAVTTGIPSVSAISSYGISSSVRISNTVRSISGNCCNAASTARTSALCSICVCALIPLSGIFSSSCVWRTARRSKSVYAFR